MILTALSTLTFLGKNIPSLNQLTYNPSLGIHPGCKQRMACFWVLETQSTAGEDESAVLSLGAEGSTRALRLLSVAHLVCVMHESTKTFVGMFIFLLTPLFGTTGSAHMPEPGEPASLSFTHTCPVWLTQHRRSKMQAKPWTVLSLL